MKLNLLKYNKVQKDERIEDDESETESQSESAKPKKKGPIKKKPSACIAAAGTRSSICHKDLSKLELLKRPAKAW